MDEEELLAGRTMEEVTNGVPDEETDEPSAVTKLVAAEERPADEVGEAEDEEVEEADDAEGKELCPPETAEDGREGEV